MRPLYGAICALSVLLLACTSNGAARSAPPTASHSPADPADQGDAHTIAPTPRVARSTLARDQPLPALARKLIRTFMLDHGETMETLLWSALMLDHDDITTATRWMLDKPRLSRPAASAGETLNDALPDAFFALQDQLYDGAATLNDAARRADDLATARAYAALVETCVTCHALYLRLPGEE